MEYEDYCRQYGGAEVISKRFYCDLCNSEMEFCRTTISSHMKDVHRMSLEDYESKIGMGRNGEYVPESQTVSKREMNQPTTNKSIPTRDHSRGVSNSNFQGNSQTGTPYNPITGTNGLLDEGKNPSRWNKCKFSCVLCKKLSSEKRIHWDLILYNC